jgi:energy-coupling factor transport system permease protein
LGVPVVEILLTLTLALRFVPLVLEEIQNLVRAIRTRAINWKRLGLKRTVHLWLVVLERLVKNLFLRAQQTADAMQARGFTDPNSHLVKWRSLRLTNQDYLALGSLAFWLVARIVLGGA